MTSPQDIEHYFQVAQILTFEAAQIIRKHINEPKAADTKSADRDLVTKHDAEVEKLLFANLSKEFPTHKFIGEEASSKEDEIPELTDSPTWIIDPIGGTTNFVHSFPQTCISIGLAINKKIEIGIIYNPCYDEMYTAKRGHGAFFNGKRIQTSSTKELKKSLVLFELSSISTVPPKNVALAHLQALVRNTQGIRSIGSAALSLAHLARGTVDIYQNDEVKPWDVAAGSLIVTEAGGTIIDTKGAPFDFMKPKVIAASNEALAVETSQLMIQSALVTQWKTLGK